MAALTKDRNTPRREGDLISLPAAAAVKCFAGSIAARDGSGNARPGRVATTDKGLGRVEALADNAAGAAGAINVEIRKGVFKFGNSSAGDLIADADIGNDCYIVDDQTVAKTSATNTRSVAGKVFKVESDGVWVDFR